MLEGGERNDQLTYPDDEWFYFLCADRFGWTPTQVDEQPAGMMDWLLSISTLVKEIQNADVKP